MFMSAPLVSIFSYNCRSLPTVMGECRMSEQLTWNLRHEATASARACFYWKKDGQIVRSAEFTRPELETECERLSEAGKDVTQFALALIQLALSRDSQQESR
jgi:hypothetical protein